MKRYSPRRSRSNYFLVATLLFSFALFQGCDGLNEVTATEDRVTPERVAPPVSDANNKLRHPAQLDQATRNRIDQAGKTVSTTTDLLVSYNTYEADGITPRLINKFELTKRILNEYGITRRVLNQYGITHRILNEYGITRRVLNQYGITKRVLDKYGLTPRVLGQYTEGITDAVLAELGLSENQLAAEGLTSVDLQEFNRLTALLGSYEITVNQFLEDLENYEPAIRTKIYLDGANLGVSISIIDTVLNTFLDEIATDSDILFVEPDVALSVPELGQTSGQWYDKQITPWGISNLNTPIPGILTVLGESYVKDNPVHVYILDSGAMKDTWLDDLNYVEKKDFTMLFENPTQQTWEEDSAPDVSGFDPGDAGNPYDESGHGTHIAGTIGAENNLHGVVGVAPSVRLHSLKVLNAQGQTDITTLMAAVDYVTRAKRANPERPIVVNISLGVDIGTTAYNILDEAIAASIQEGVIYVAAAGNEGRSADTYSPAHVAEVITVGAYNESNAFSSFSNYGPAVDVLAPGENIISLSHELEDTKSFQSILTSGTSHAAPHVTGAVARYLGKNPHATAGEVKEALKKASTETVYNAPTGTQDMALNVQNLLGGEEVKEDTQKSRSRYFWSWGSWSNNDKTLRMMIKSCFL